MLFFIAGPPFSGKTTVGRLLAGIMACPFTDLDRFIEERAGMSIADIFNSIGEKGFRLLESASLAELATGTHEHMVVALGGGTLLIPENLAVVRARGALFTLSAEPAVLAGRFSQGRPLARDREGLERLLRERAEHYDSLPGRIDTRGKTPGQVAGLIAEQIASLPRLQQAPPA